MTRSILVPLVVLLAGCAGPPPADPPASSGAVVAFGDSYTAGTGVPRDFAYPARLAAHLDRAVVNAGVHGETAEEALARFDEDVAAHRPAVVVVEFGVNEAFRGYSASRSLSAIEEIANRSLALGARVVLVDAVSAAVGDAGTPGGSVRYYRFMGDFERGLEEMRDRLGVGLVPDAMDGILENESTRSDPYHPNAEGYAILESRIRPAVERALTS